MRVVRNISLTAVDTGGGTAAEDQILDGEIAYSQGAELTGTMPNNAGDVAAISYHRDGTSLHIIPAEGYVDGIDDAVVITDADFVATNIAHNIEIFGLTGTYDTEAGSPIAAGTVLLDKIGFVNGTKITGTMPNNAGDTAAESSHVGEVGEIHIVPAAGYYDGTDDATVITDADFVANSIKHNVEIFGLTGSYDTEAENPIAAGDVLLDKVGFVNGTKIIGNMPNNAGDNASLSNSTTGTTVKLVAPEGYYDGSDDTVTVTDANLIAENIKSGVTILGVLGTYTGA